MTVQQMNASIKTHQLRRYARYGIISPRPGIPIYAVAQKRQTAHVLRTPPM